MKNLGAAHNIGVFLMLYKSQASVPEVVSRGTFMGEQFVDMCAKEKVSDISGNFLSFGSGQEVIKKITG
jgi:hypothetical protein